MANALLHSVRSKPMHLIDLMYLQFFWKRFHTRLGLYSSIYYQDAFLKVCIDFIPLNNSPENLNTLYNTNTLF